MGQKIYFIQGEKTGLIKIGQSNQVKMRYNTLCSENADRLRVLLVTTKHVEYKLHERFAIYRSHGEWFHPHMELMKFIHTLANEEDIKQNDYSKKPKSFQESQDVREVDGQKVEKLVKELDLKDSWKNA